MKRVYMIWPSDREGVPIASLDAWTQAKHWLVLDVTDGIERGRVVEGPVDRPVALRRELELRSVDLASTKVRRRIG